MYDIDCWLQALEARHLRNLSFSEVVRALRALSARYVARRTGIGSALDTAGKRAAFALYYGPLHFLLVGAIVRRLGATGAPRILDLGCGTGVGGAAWAIATTEMHGRAAGSISVCGVDRHPWAVAEAAWTFKTLGVSGRAKRGDVLDVKPARGGAVLAAFAVNELAATDRALALARLVRSARRGHAVLIVEPIARSIAPWWRAWTDEFGRCGGRADEWRLPIELPEMVAELDRAAGLDHRVLTARTIWVPK